MLLEDGTVIPHYLGLIDSSVPEDPQVLTNFSLRHGEVVDIIHSDDPRNKSKKFTEYNVLVQHFDHNTETNVIKEYTNCYLINGLSGLADKYRYTLRMDPTKQGPLNKQLNAGQGSKVLVLCINGITSQGVILGGLRDERDRNDSKEAGHHLEWEFNGINVTVNDSGELTVVYRGKTNIDGSVNESVGDVGGTRIQLSKDGSFLINTKDQTFLVDNTNKKVHIASSDEFLVESSGDVTIHANKNVKIDCVGILTVEAGTGIALIPGPSGDVTSQVLIGAATDEMIKGGTYRRAEAQMNQNLSSGLAALATALAAASTALGLGDTTSAGIALGQASGIVFNMGSDVGTFESNADNYLSKQNRSD